MSYLTTVTGSYPRKEIQKDTLRKPSVSDEEAIEMIKWASIQNCEFPVGCSDPLAENYYCNTKMLCLC